MAKSKTASAYLTNYISLITWLFVLLHFFGAAYSQTARLRSQISEDEISIANMRKLLGQNKKTKKIQQLGQKLGIDKKYDFGNTSSWVSNKLGVELQFDSVGNLNSLFIKKQYPGKLPNALSFTDNQRQIVSTLGLGKIMYLTNMLEYESLGIQVSFFSFKEDSKINYIRIYDPVRALKNKKLLASLKEMTQEVLPKIAKFSRKPRKASNKSKWINGKVIVIKDGKYDSSFLWASIPVKFRPTSVEQVKTAIVVTESEEKTGHFTDGSIATRVIWKVKLMNLDSKTIFHDVSFEGPDPPKSSSDLKRSKQVPVKPATKFFTNLDLRN